jgi:hypothetical protein
LLFPGDSIATLADRAIDHEVPVREQPVTLPQELDREVEVTPTPQLAQVEIAASQVTLFRLRGSEYIGLVFRFEDEKLPPIVLQELHHPFLALVRMFGDVHAGRLHDRCPASLPYPSCLEREIGLKRHLRRDLRDVPDGG